MVNNVNSLDPPSTPAKASASSWRPTWEVATTFLKLGCTCFGGPIAHISYFHNEFVLRKKWLDESTFGDFVALAQFLPGPTSSQLTPAIGKFRAGWPGAIAASVCFTLPSAILMILFGYGVGSIGDIQHAGWLHGLKSSGSSRRGPGGLGNGPAILHRHVRHSSLHGHGVGFAAMDCRHEPN